MTPSTSNETNTEGLCPKCNGPIEPARLELGLRLCFSCADKMDDSVRPKGNIVTIDSDSNTELDIVRVSDLPQRHIIRKHQ